MCERERERENNSAVLCRQAMFTRVLSIIVFMCQLWSIITTAAFLLWANRVSSGEIGVTCCTRPDNETKAIGCAIESAAAAVDGSDDGSGGGGGERRPTAESCTSVLTARI